MKIVTFNINGIRAHPHQLKALTAHHDPDIVGLQESKVADEDFPCESVETLGYIPHYFGQKSHYGVALMSRRCTSSPSPGKPLPISSGFCRLIMARYALPDGQELTLINGYFPQGESREHPVKFPAKRKFYADLTALVRRNFTPDQNLVILGDMNVAPLNPDIGIGPDNAKRWLRTGKCSFLPEEQEWLATLTDWGLYDAFRVIHPQANDRFSWFDYRSRGFERKPKRGLRIDLILITPPLRARLADAGIDYEIRGMPKPSDHCPVWASFDL